MSQSKIELSLEQQQEQVRIDLAAMFRLTDHFGCCLLYTSPSPRDLSTSRMPSSA